MTTDDDEVFVNQGILTTKSPGLIPGDVRHASPSSMNLPMELLSGYCDFRDIPNGFLGRVSPRRFGPSGLAGEGAWGRRVL